MVCEKNSCKCFSALKGFCLYADKITHCFIGQAMPLPLLLLGASVVGAAVVASHVNEKAKKECLMHSTIQASGLRTTSLSNCMALDLLKRCLQIGFLNNRSGNTLFVACNSIGEPLDRHMVK
jgi:hypothetical protein